MFVPEWGLGFAMDCRGCTPGPRQSYLSPSPIGSVGNLGSREISNLLLLCAMTKVVITHIVTKIEIVLLVDVLFFISEYIYMCVYVCNNDTILAKQKRRKKMHFKNILYE